MKNRTGNDDYELREDYDLSKMRIVAKGRYAPHRRLGKNVVLLDSEIAAFFPTDESVNEALRFIMQAAKIPFRQGKEQDSP